MKKGNIFILEFIVGAIILFSYLVYIQPYQRSTPDIGLTIEGYAKDSVELFRDTRVDKFNDETLRAIPSGALCMSCFMSEQIALLLLTDQFIAAANATNQTLQYLIPQNLGYSIALTSQGLEKEVLVQNASTSGNLFVASTLVSGLNGSTRNAFLFEIRVFG